MLKPLAYTVQNAGAAIGCGTTKLYELMSSGTLDCRKLGGRTIILAESLENYIASLPPADIRTKPRRSGNASRGTNAGPGIERRSTTAQQVAG